MSSASRQASSDAADGRELILAAAIRSFSEVGYDGTTTAGVARAAGVTQPLVHHHFGSKEGLWRAAMAHLFSEVRMFTKLDPALPPMQALLGATERFVRMVAARPEITRVIAREGTAESPRLNHLIDEYLGEQFREIVDMLEAGQATGLVNPDVRPDLLLFFVLGAGSHVFDVSALARKSLGIDTTAEKTRDDFVGLVLSVLTSGVFRAPAGAR